MTLVGGVRYLILLLLTINCSGLCVRSLSTSTTSGHDRIVAEAFMKKGFNVHTCTKTHEVLEVWYYSYNVSGSMGPTQFVINSTNSGNPIVGQIYLSSPEASGTVWTVTFAEDWVPIERRLSPSLGAASKGLAKWTGHILSVKSAGRN